MPDCLDPNKPSVDNSAIACTELVSTDCIITENADTYLRYGKNVTLTKVLKVISSALQKVNTTFTNYLPAYKSYVVTLQQLATNAPIASEVMDSRLSLTPVYAKTSNGEYTLTSVNAFPLEKTIIIPPSSRNIIIGGIVTEVHDFFAERLDESTIVIKSTRRTGAMPVLTDDLLDGVHTTLEIRVYK